MKDDGQREDHLLFSTVPGIASGLVQIVLKVLQKRGVIESPREWWPLGPLSSGLAMLVLAVSRDNKRAKMIGLAQVAGGSIALVLVRKKAAKGRDELAGNAGS